MNSKKNYKVQDFPSWKEFAWKTFLFHTWNSSDGYIDLMRDNRFTGQMWNVLPKLNDPNYIAQRIIKFLGKYGCHTPNSDSVTNDLEAALKEAERYLQALSERIIENVNFNTIMDDNICGNMEGRTVKDVVEYLYKRFDKVPRIGTTATGKLLHVLRPKLFLMWDKGIRKHYSISNSSRGYCLFLTKMKAFAETINRVFNEAYPCCPQPPATYLSQKFDIDPPKTLAKFIDEYNWMTFTKEIATPPPSWYPY